MLSNTLAACISLASLGVEVHFENAADRLRLSAVDQELQTLAA